MQQQTQPQQQPHSPVDPSSLDSPSGEELKTGALMELIKEAGLDPLAPGSSMPGQDSPRPQIPDWFLKASDSI